MGILSTRDALHAPRAMESPLKIVIKGIMIKVVKVSFMLILHHYVH